MYNSKIKLIISGLLINGLLCSNSEAEVVVNTDTGTSNLDAVNNIYNISDTLGQIEGANLFHSFDRFNVYSGETANFEASTGIHNIITRVTGSASTIDGAINSPTNFFLLNSHGIMFGAGATLNITGSFHASTADFITLGDTDVVHTNAPVDAPLSSAPPSAFGFTSDNPAAITVSGATLDNRGQTLSLVGGDITMNNGARLTSADGLIQVASIASPGEVLTDVGSMDGDGFASLGAIQMSENSSIDSSGSGGGKIVIRGGQLQMDSASIKADAATFAVNDGLETVDIVTSESVVVDQGSEISSSLGAGALGSTGGIKINTAYLAVDHNSSINTNTESSSIGNASDIRIDAEHIVLNNGSKISTGTGGFGDSGDISIQNTQSLDISNESSIETAALFYLDANFQPVIGFGKSGNIVIDADDINITGLEETADYDLFQFSGINAGTPILSFNDSGNIDITTNNLTLNHNGKIRTASIGTNSNSGSININADKIFIGNGASIYTLSDGDAGEININSNELTVSGASQNTIPYAPVYISSSIIRSGGGETNINISSDSVTLTDGGFLSSEAQLSDSPNAGDVNITASTVNIHGFNERIYNSYIENGVSTEQALHASRSHINASSTILTDLQNSTASAGSIHINASELNISDNGGLVASSTLNPYWDGSATAGNIYINADHIKMNGAYISAHASRDNGGNITIKTGYDAIITNSQITASTGESDGDGGNIYLSSNFLYLNNNHFTATAVEGNGGNISVDARESIITKNNIFDVHSQFAANGNVTLTAIDSDNGIVDHSNNDSNTKSKFVNDCGGNREQNSSLILRPMLIPYRYAAETNNLYLGNTTEHTNLTTQALSKNIRSLLKYDNTTDCS